MSSSAAVKYDNVKYVTLTNISFLMWPTARFNVYSSVEPCFEIMLLLEFEPIDILDLSSAILKLNAIIVYTTIMCNVNKRVFRKTQFCIHFISVFSQYLFIIMIINTKQNHITHKVFTTGS